MIRGPRRQVHVDGVVNLHPIGTFARLAFARATRCPATKIQPQSRTSCGPAAQQPPRQACAGCCRHVPEEVFAALDRAYPVVIDSRDYDVTRQELAELIAPLMAIQGWRFCKCYHAGFTAEHRFIASQLDPGAANALAGTRPDGTPLPTSAEIRRLQALLRIAQDDNGFERDEYDRRVEEARINLHAAWEAIR